MNSTFRREIAAGLLLWLSAAASAEGYPERPVQVDMQYSAGSGPDALMRRMSDSLGRQWGRPLVIVNKPGANGWLAASGVKRAAADGYSLLVTDNSAVALQPLMFKGMPFDPVTDFEPVTGLYSTYFFVVVASDSPWKNVADLLDAARAMKGDLTVASFGTASVNQVGIATFEDATQTKMTLVPYKSLQDMFTDVSAGRVSWGFGTAATTAPYIQGKRLRLLAIAAPKRIASHADVPTVAESGGPIGFELKTWVALYAPRGTPRAVVNRIHDGMSRAMSDEGPASYLAANGLQRWNGTTDDVEAATAADRARFKAIVKKANLQPN